MTDDAAQSFSLIDAIPVPALVVAGDDALVAGNDALHGLFPGLRMGRSYLTVLRQPELTGLVAVARAGRDAAAVELTIRGDGARVFRATCARIAPDNVLICLQDINETAAAVQMRRDFIADLSHELRTPLTAIRGILDTGADDAEALAHFLPVLSKEVERMNRLVSDLLALSRVQANARRQPTGDVHLQTVIRDACAPLRAMAANADVRIETDLPDQAVHLTGDADELTRALSNLIENAVRYGAAGGVVNVTLRLMGRDMAELTVRDKGAGVEAHHIPRLTERFYRVDSHRSRQAGGSGLGLAIVKHVVTHHRGRLSFESQPGAGLTVRITLPGAKVADG